MSVIHLVALSARTPVGFRAESSAAAIRAAVSRVTTHPIFVDAEGEPVRCGRDAQLSPKLIGRERLLELAELALAELVEKLAAHGRADGPLPVLLALPEARPGFDAADAQWVARSLTARTPGARIDAQTVGSGHAGGAWGIAEAIKRIQQQRSELCIVGGADSYLDGATLDWLEEARRLACQGSRSGFSPGEGASFVALASDGLRRQLRLPSLGVIRAAACTVETRLEASPESLQGEALTAAFQKVAADLRRPDERFDDCYCDINGERARTDDFAFALLRVGGLFRDGSDYRTPVAAVGDQGAATISLNCVLAARSWARQYASGTTALIFGASWAGSRGAVLLERPV
jgi:3-oxoacyl-[acyl-carrier-protein] synthase-1